MNYQISESSDGMQAASDEYELGYVEGLQHYYREELLDAKIQENDEKGIKRSAFIEGFLQNASRIIRQDPIRYQSFGMYWWWVKRELNERFPDPTAWWYKGHYDERIMELTDRGSTIKNLMQALLYHQENWTNTGQQDYMLNGISRIYSLCDYDLGA